MVKITLEVSEELSEKLTQLGDVWRQAALRLRLPELLALSLEQPPLPSRVYQYIVDFLVSNPTSEQILAFRPTAQMQERMQTLLRRSKAGELNPTEQKELDEYERIEHLMVMLKTGNLPTNP
ncbi:hypothetical protein CEN45_12265 [Fischerella thermalis CCMEE 5198]|uniref:hypothetical protein n=1 Tax=Fischerella thermalis TaxID=372787 RepID=UPI000C7FA6FE|nr:hypothetical protein [Fischerella thermalis]PMB01616.1 hypothetical protein CI594_09075 [Fischerella thermalis CCMEE 5196]PMB22565.1 hypothetical protein CEN45_12265 [Fischerella thermalis CCMEE 5198]